jgi:membrane protein DedA with SNARE-associated domain
MIDPLIQWAAHHGYGVIFVTFALGVVALPIPNELLLAYLGHLVYKGQLAALPTVGAAFLGSVCGMMVNYALGRTIGGYLIKRFGVFVNVTEGKVERVHDWFERRGRWGLLVGYFLPGVRHLTAFVAGTSRMSFAEFSFFMGGGALIWSALFIFLGFFFENRWSRETARIHHILEIASVTVLIIGGACLVVRRIRNRNKA